MFNSNEVSLIEIAQQCNVSVRDIHFASKELGHELAPTAKGVASSLAKTLIDHFHSIESIKAKKKQHEKKAPSKNGIQNTVEKNITLTKAKEDKPSFNNDKLKSRPAFVVIEPEIVTKSSLNSYSSNNIIPSNKKEIFEKKMISSKQHSIKKKNNIKISTEKNATFANAQKFSGAVLRPIFKDTKKNKSIKRDTSISDELLGVKDDNRPKSTIDLYGEIMDKEKDREIVHNQRKSVAGKDFSKVKKAPTVSHTVKYDPNRIVEIPELISVKEFAEKTGLGAARVIGELMKNGILANINQQIDFDTASIIADDLKVKLSKKRSVGSAEDMMKGDLTSLLAENDTKSFKTRPPIVVVMGHVDHGKTKLLDSIRHSDVVSTESGGITQHIGAYQIEKNGRKITFIDTPGHEAFTTIRARGAKVTDIAILVVAADEGVKPQTIEAISHARNAGVPIIVAINKIDKPEADIERVKGELAKEDLIPEEWGGKTIFVPVSAITKQGIDTLLEMVLLMSDMADLKANYERNAIGTVIEAHLDQSLGPVATVIVNAGTLRIMDNIVIGQGYGRVKVMKDHRGKKITEALPSTPVFLAGLSSSAVAGDIVQAVPDDKTARLKALDIRVLRDALQKERGVGEIMSAISSGTLKNLNLVIKADTVGSLDAIKQLISKIKHEDVAVKVILSNVGDINESDVMMAAASGGIVMGFHVKVGLNAQTVAERENVEIINYDIIYKMVDDIRKILSGMLEPEFKEIVLGELEVKAIFFTKRKEKIIGCSVKGGSITRDSKLRLFRNGELLGEIRIESLQKNQDTIHEVKEGNDCGIKVSGIPAVEVGDKLQAFKMDKTIRTL